MVLGRKVFFLTEHTPQCCSEVRASNATRRCICSPSFSGRLVQGCVDQAAAGGYAEDRQMTFDNPDKTRYTVIEMTVTLPRSLYLF